MKISKNGINMLESLEAKRLKPYDDQTGKTIKLWKIGATIGIGHLISKRSWDKYKYGITDQQANELLKRDLMRFEECINQNIKVEINQCQFDALIIFCFNIGIRHFKESSALKLINNPKAKTDYENLEKAWKAWNKSQGDISRGLINRRIKEWQLYELGSYC